MPGAVMGVRGKALPVLEHSCLLRDWQRPRRLLGTRGEWQEEWLTNKTMPVGKLLAA